MREIFNIKMKVELLEEKIRKNFSYWLDLCSKKADKSVVYDGKIIIVLEGLEYFKDFETQRESNIKFWLPKSFPKNVRIIVTASKDSKSFEHLSKLQCEKISLKPDISMMEAILNKIQSKQFLCEKEHQEKLTKILNDKVLNRKVESTMYFKAATSMLSPYPTEGVIEYDDVDNQKINEIVTSYDLSRLEDINTIEELVNELVSFFEKKLIKPAIFKNLLSYLAVTFKGLKLEEIEKLTGINYDEWKLVLCFFKSFFFTHKGLWKIRNQVLSKVVKERYVNSEEKAKDIHLNIANVIEDEVFTLRILEEKTNHYYIAKEYNMLK